MIAVDWDNQVMGYTSRDWCGIDSDAQYQIFCDIGDVCWWFPGHPLWVQVANMYITGSHNISFEPAILLNPHEMPEVIP